MNRMFIVTGVLAGLVGSFIIYTVLTTARPESAIAAFYKGNHALRKMAGSKIDNPGKINGFFIFGIGWANGSSGTTEESVTFAWLNNEGEYVITKLPLSKIRIKIENVENPYVKFKWRVDYTSKKGDNIVYAVLVCKDSDWPQDINLPLNRVGN